MSNETPIKSIFETSSSKSSSAPKKSHFERQKAEAEAKRQRDKAETAAVYEDFVKSFDQDTDAATPSSTSGGRSLQNAASATVHGHPSSGLSKRHFAGPLMRNLPSENLGRPPLSFSRKRPYDSLKDSQRDRDKPRGLFAFEGSRTEPINAFQTSDDEEDKAADTKEAEKAAAKPTLHVSSLPPGTSPAVIKSLIPSILSVDNVKILPPAPPSSHGGSERRIWSAIVTLAHDTAATDMDTVVSSLQNKYLGWGFYLSISRHLSSAAIHSTMPIVPGVASLTNHPFGARPIVRGGHFGRGGPHRSGIAPPSSYGAGYEGRGNQGLQIDVKPPSDLRQLKLIHKTIESLLTFGPEFEALLMSRAEVQKEEKWAWIWDPKSPGGIWYRWKLWDILTSPEKKDRRGRSIRSTIIFENGPSWVEPERSLQFEFTTKLEEFVSDEDYDSSDEDDSDREEERRNNEAANDTSNDGLGHLNPLQKAKLTHLLARLPTSHSKLRRGDVARVTAFAIKHAGGGGDEVVDMIVSNVTKPFTYTSANPEKQKDENEARGIGLEDAGEPTANDNPDSAEPNKTPSPAEKLDVSSAILVGLYIISDILSSSSTSGVRHAWRYRQLFEASFKQHRTFEKLGRIEKELKWGRLKIEKWRRSIGILLNLWEGWCVFPQPSHEALVKSFDNPPPTEKERAEEKAREVEEKEAGVFGGKGKKKWKAVGDNEDASRFIPAASHGDDGPMELDDVDGAPINDDVDLDGEPMSDIDGVPMEDSDLEMIEDAPRDQSSLTGKEQSQRPPTKEEPASEEPLTKAVEATQPNTKRRRPKAEDMFRDSDESEG